MRLPSWPSTSNAASVATAPLAVFSTLLDYAHTNVLIARRGLRLHVDATDAEVHAVPKDDVTKMLAAVRS